VGLATIVKLAGTSSSVVAEPSLVWRVRTGVGTAPTGALG
jgi:hypothetical protein